MKPNVELHIEELVLHGFNPGDRQRIGEVLQVELARLLVEQGVPSMMARSGEYPVLQAGLFQVGTNPDAACIGRQLAETLYESLQSTTNHNERR